MIFGLFESKEAKFWRDETNRTLNDARQRFDASERKKISEHIAQDTGKQKKRKKVRRKGQIGI